MRTDVIVDEILAKHLPREVFDALPSLVKAGIDRSIRQALVVGEITGVASAGRALDPLSRSIALDAAAFEASLRLPVPPTRAKCGVYPWGWRYVDEGVQDKFRTYVRGEQKHINSKESHRENPLSVQG